LYITAATALFSRAARVPGAFSFNPSDLGPAPANSVALQYYSFSHPTLGEWNEPTIVSGPPWTNSWNNSGNPGYRGVVVPKGARTALYFGSQGLGTHCYGTGSECGDPTDIYQGEHGYPYRNQIMAFDLNEWVEVEKGNKEPYEVLPYAIWPLVPPEVPFTSATNGKSSGGATIDLENNRIYWEQATAYGYGNPIIHVWKINEAATVNVQKEYNEIPDKLKIFPNPFNPTTTISFPNPSHNADIFIYDMKGREVKRFKILKYNRLTWHAWGFSAGIYQLIIKTDNKTYNKAIMLLK